MFIARIDFGGNAPVDLWNTSTPKDIMRTQKRSPPLSNTTAPNDTFKKEIRMIDAVGTWELQQKTIGSDKPTILIRDHHILDGSKVVTMY